MRVDETLTLQTMWSVVWSVDRHHHPIAARAAMVVLKENKKMALLSSGRGPIICSTLVSFGNLIVILFATGLYNGF